jgi:hypothetical protein
MYDPHIRISPGCTILVRSGASAGNAVWRGLDDAGRAGGGGSGTPLGLASRRGMEERASADSGGTQGWPGISSAIGRSRLCLFTFAKSGLGVREPLPVTRPARADEVCHIPHEGRRM